MKTVYIPKGETVHYESLVTERLVVHGHLHVTYGIKAKAISGKGVINAGTIEANTVCMDDVEAASVICKRLLAKRVQAPVCPASCLPLMWKRESSRWPSARSTWWKRRRL